MRAALLSHWHWTRLLRLAIGLVILIQGAVDQQLVLVALGAAFTALPLFSAYCGPVACAPAPQSETITETPLHFQTLDDMQEKRTFSEIVAAEPLVFVDFYADWCGPCKMMNPVVQELKKQMGDQITILKVDVDRNPAAAQAYRIQGVPTFVLFRKGKIVWQQAGAQSLSALQSLIRSHL